MLRCRSPEPISILVCFRRVYEAPRRRVWKAWKGYVVMVMGVKASSGVECEDFVVVRSTGLTPNYLPCRPISTYIDTCCMCVLPGAQNGICHARPRQWTPRIKTQAVRSRDARCQESQGQAGTGVTNRPAWDLVDSRRGTARMVQPDTRTGRLQLP